MKTIRKLTVLTTTIALWTSFASTSFAGAFFNGSFELPGGLPPGTMLCLGTGDTALTGWVIGGPDTAAGVCLHNGTRQCLDFPAADGDYHLLFNGGDGAPGRWIAQTFDTVPGEEYEVTFNVGRVCVGGGTVSLTASAKSEAGSILGSMVAVASVNGYGSRQRFVFTATTTNTTVEFLDSSVATVSVDIVLDNVAVSPVRPELSIQVSEVAVCWLATSNRLYQVQTRSELTTNTWVDVGVPILGTGDTHCFRDSILGQPRKFYRVIKLP